MGGMSIVRAPDTNVTGAALSSSGINIIMSLNMSVAVVLNGGTQRLVRSQSHVLVRFSLVSRSSFVPAGIRPTHMCSTTYISAISRYYVITLLTFDLLLSKAHTSRLHQSQIW